MITLRTLLPTLCLATGLAGVAAYAYADAPDSAGGAPAVSGHRWHGHHGGPFAHVLKQLNLTADQQTQVKSIFAQAKSQMKTQHESMRANHEALMAASPTDANYPSLLATEKSNAAARVQAMSDIKSQIYAVLTPEQRAQVPSLIAAEQAARAQKFAALRAQHEPQ